VLVECLGIDGAQSRTIADPAVMMKAWGLEADVYDKWEVVKNWKDYVVVCV
jgi:hypothetical protein